MCIVIEAAVLVASEGHTVEKDGGQGCYNITMGRKGRQQT